MERLKKLLLRPIKDTPRTREYQRWLDDAVDRTLEKFDRERGLAATKGVDLPDEKIDGYIDMPLTERERLTSDKAAEALANSASRRTSAPLSVMAFCYRSPLSRHYGKEHIILCVKNGLEAFRKRQRSNGIWVFGLSEETGFGLGWTVEGLIYSFILIYGELDAGFREGLMEMFSRGAEWLKQDAGFHPVSNQHTVWCSTMALYGQLLERKDYLDAAARQWQVAQHVLARDGQVIEQGGPCANYSRTTFAYAWSYLRFADNSHHDEQIKEALRWFRRMHTNSMYPFEGMSSRSAHFQSHSLFDTLPALEQFAPQEPILGKFIDDFIAAEKRAKGSIIGVTPHLGSPVFWAMLEHEETVRPSRKDIDHWEKPFDRMYWKWDIQYLLVHREYQTAVTFRGRMPLRGLQTWAWRDEEPILHPTLDCPSKTIAWGVDTAEFNVGHNRAGRGAGSKSEEVLYVPGEWAELDLKYEPKGMGDGIYADPTLRYFRWTQGHHKPGAIDRFLKPGDPAQVATRWGRLWCIYIFTPVATVVIQNGEVGPRITRWTFNPICTTEPSIKGEQLTFEGREGKIHYLSGKPRLIEVEDARAAEFEFRPNELAAFAFSDDSFEFVEYKENEGHLKFSDSSGDYTAEFADIMRDKSYLNWDMGGRAFRTKIE